jgi:hypothetical protein
VRREPRIVAAPDGNAMPTVTLCVSVRETVPVMEASANWNPEPFGLNTTLGVRDPSIVVVNVNWSTNGEAPPDEVPDLELLAEVLALELPAVPPDLESLVELPVVLLGWELVVDKLPNMETSKKSKTVLLIPICPVIGYT